MESKGKLGKIMIGGIEIKPQDDFNLDLISIEDSIIDSFMKTGIHNYSASIECQPVDMEAFNKFLGDLVEYERIKKQQELKEKLLRKWLIKLFNKEINRLDTGKFIYEIDWEHNEIIIYDKSQFIFKN